MKRFVSSLFAPLLLATSALAQPDLLSTVGLAHRDATGRDWAYIVWQSPNSAVVSGSAFAVYAKPGLASSTNEYERKAIVVRQRDTHVINPLLQRSINLGEDLAALEGDLDKLFGEIMPAGTLGVAAKLSAVLRGTTGNDRAYRNLTLLSRIHPGVALCLGTADAELFPAGVSNLTFEVRQWDAAQQTDLAVVGRVTVTAGAQLFLPPPGMAVEVPDVTASGNLNVKLRWPVPDTLRRLSLATHGFNLWRMNRAYAEANGFHLTPPTTAQLLAAPASVAGRLNGSPILAAKYFNAVNVADFSTNGDPKTFFFIDDNKFFLPGNVQFQDGQPFYYFVTARDLLGRDGNVSPGLLARACDRIPPQAPRHLRVMSVHSYTGGQGREGLKLTWNPPPGPPAPYGYHVYRYGSLQEMQTNSHFPASNRIAGPLVFPPGTSPLNYTDQPCTNGGDSTFWYVVRAAEARVCVTNLSQPSAPAWGACRDWSGPPGAAGVVVTTCIQPVVNCVSNLSVADQPHPGLCHFRLVCHRDSRFIDWAEFHIVGSTNTPGRIYFPPKGKTVTQDVYLKAGQNYQFTCRVGTVHGAIDDGGPCQTLDCTANNLNVYVFEATTRRIVTTNDTQGLAGCQTHFRQFPYPDPNFGTNSYGTNDGINVTLNLPMGTKEYRLYRSVDGGPKGLVSQGSNTTTSVVNVVDNALPASSCTICYYAQSFDEHGNPGPLQRVEPCVPVAGLLPPPQQLPVTGSTLSILGSQMNLSWFCPSPGVDHFEVWISDAGGITSSDLTLVPRVSAFVPKPVLGPVGPAPMIAAPLSEYTIYRTPRVGAAFGNNDLFAVNATTVAGRTHKILIRAVDIHGNTGPFSNEEEFRGSLQKIMLTPQVAWPARELPLPTNRVYTPSIRLINLNGECFDGIGILVGEVSQEGSVGCSNIQLIPSQTELATDLRGSNFMPVVVYRQQVSNIFFPTVSGDVVQVSPLIEKIAMEPLFGGNIEKLVDPFFTIWPKAPQLQDLVLKDTQPVVVGARYRYVFVRFKENHELEKVIPIGEVEVTP